jgi:predicted transposase YbfD/YdcC
LTDNELLTQKLSFDALHGTPKTLLLITASKGKYLVGLKENQKQLLRAVIKTSENQAILWKISGTQKGHGRIETRRYEFYDILEIEQAARWTHCEMRTAVKVMRQREEVKSGSQSQETSYQVTNKTGNYEEIAEAIGRHWQVETNNHLRDVTLKEDQMRSKKRIYSNQSQKLEQWQQLS